MGTVTRRDRIVLPVLIPNGAALSGVVSVNGLEVVGVAMPAVWTAAGITFAGLLPDGTYGKIQNDGGTEILVTAPAAGTYVAFTNGGGFLVKGLGQIKIRSGTNAAPVNQGADRTLWLICLT